jgi:hypothetical protein
VREAAGQDVGEEAADELVRWQCHGLVTAGALPHGPSYRAHPRLYLSSPERVHQNVRSRRKQPFVQKKHTPELTLQIVWRMLG